MMRSRIVRSEYIWIGIAFVLAVVAAYVVLQARTTSTFDRLERQEISSQADRIRTSLVYESSLINNFTQTNSEWDDPYLAITHRDSGAMAGLFPARETHASFGFDGLILLGRSGAVVSGGLIDSSRNRYAAVPSPLRPRSRNLPSMARAPLAASSPRRSRTTSSVLPPSPIRTGAVQSPDRLSR